MVKPRPRHRLGRAVTGSGEQLERAAAVGLGAVARAAGLGHGVGGRWLNWGREDTTRPGAKAAAAAACALFRRARSSETPCRYWTSPPGCHFGVLALPRGTLKIDERPDPPLSIQRAGA
jgi:hypothetical protein